jgi:hypothetical protein
MIIYGLFETVRVSAAGQYPFLFFIFKKKLMKKRKEKKTSRYRLSANKMCLSGIYYSKMLAVH